MKVLGAGILDSARLQLPLLDPQVAREREIVSRRDSRDLS
jgi:hypothetical protein